MRNLLRKVETDCVLTFYVRVTDVTGLVCEISDWADKIRELGRSWSVDRKNWHKHAMHEITRRVGKWRGPVMTTSIFD